VVEAVTKFQSMVMTTLIVALAGVGLSRPVTAWGESTTYFRRDSAGFRASAAAGKKMFQAYQCAKCHAIREGQPMNSDIIAPNLILAKKRLRPRWILQWLIEPQSIQPGTKMPNFFFFNEDDDGNPIYNDADAHDQFKIIVSLRDYLMVLGTDEEPGGHLAPVSAGQ